MTSLPHFASAPVTRGICLPALFACFHAFPMAVRLKSWMLFQGQSRSSAPRPAPWVRLVLGGLWSIRPSVARRMNIPKPIP